MTVAVMAAIAARVVIGVVGLVALVGVPGCLALYLLLHDAPAARRALLPVERGYLALVLGVGIVGPIALVLAMVGGFSLPLLVALVAALCGVAAFVIWRRPLPPAPSPTGSGGDIAASFLQDRGSLAFVALLVLAAVLFLRPGETLLGDGDAGVYYNTGVAVARTGGVRQYDPDLAAVVADAPTVRHLLRDTPRWRYRFLDGVRLTGFFAQGTTGYVMPQFVHLWAAWLAVAYALFGVLGPAYVPGVCGLLGVAGVTLLGRRLFGWPVALLAGLFLSLNGIQVWFVRQTYTEPFQQCVLFAALFGLLLLEERRDGGTMRLGAVVAAVALGGALLAHIQTLFLLPLVVAYAVVLWLLRAWRPAHTWFFAVFGGLLALALAQTGLALGYVEAQFNPTINRVLLPRWPLVLLAGGIALVAALVLNRLRSRWLPLVTTPRTARVARWCLVIAVIAYAGYAYLLRPGILMGAAEGGSFASYIGAPTPPGPAANLVRLGWYWSPLGILLAVVGVALIVARRLDRRTGALLAVALVHAAIYIEQSYTQERYLYALRRDLPVLVPAFALFAAYAVVAVPESLSRLVAQWKTRNVHLHFAQRLSDSATQRLFSGTLAACLVLFFVATSVGTWTVRRFDGAEGQLAAIAARFPTNSLLLFTGDRDQPHLLATPLAYVYGRSAFVISTENPRGDLIETWLLRESQSRPVYVLMGDNGGKLFPPHTPLVPDAAFGPSFTVTLRDFESLEFQKPHNVQTNTLRYTVYRFAPRPGPDNVLAPLPLTITMGDADEKYGVGGFWGLERGKDDPAPYRWTGLSALVRVPWTPSLAERGGTLTLRLAGGERPASLPPAQVMIALAPDVGEGGPVLRETTLPEAFTEVTVRIPPGALPASDSGTALVRIESGATAWRPQDHGQGYDARQLGVQLQSLTLVAAP